MADLTGDNVRDLLFTEAGGGRGESWSSTLVYVFSGGEKTYRPTSVRSSSNWAYMPPRCPGPDGEQQKDGKEETMTINTESAPIVVKGRIKKFDWENCAVKEHIEYTHEHKWNTSAGDFVVAKSDTTISVK